jgi:DNA-directed RNA polymerase subunit M/transcription elongation factor TFIIS
MILFKEFKHNELIYICKQCEKEYPVSPEDTIIYEFKKDSDNKKFKYERLLQNAYKTHNTPLVRRDCLECDSKYLKELILGDLKFHYVCPLGHISY